MSAVQGLLTTEAALAAVGAANAGQCTRIFIPSQHVELKKIVSTYISLNCNPSLFQATVNFDNVLPPYNCCNE